MPDTHHTRILLIDDSVADLRILTEIASARRWAVAVAFNGKDGYTKALMSHFDLILLDVHMPGMDGYGVCRLLKANDKTRSIPVIFLSSAGDQEERLQGLSLGAVDYIVKSYANEHEIAARMAIHLQKSSSPGAAANGAEGESIEPAPAAALVKAAKQVMLQALASPPAASELARRLGTTELKLNEAFKTFYNVSAFGWLREEKLRIARQMLAGTDASINDIALHLGFSSGQNFATAFKERFEGTPKEFRLAVRKQDAVGENSLEGGGTG